MLLFLQTYQNNLVKTSSVSQQIYNWGIELEQTGNEILMEECWPENQVQLRALLLYTLVTQLQKAFLMTKNVQQTWRDANIGQQAVLQKVTQIFWEKYNEETR